MNKTPMLFAWLTLKMKDWAQKKKVVVCAELWQMAE